MNNNYYLLETLAQLLQFQDSLLEALQILKKIYSTTCVDKALNSLHNGQSIEDAINYLIDDSLFTEFFTFYLKTNNVSDAIYKSLTICKKKKEVQNNLIRSMLYPCLLLGGLIIFSIVAVFYLQPEFIKFFSSFDIQISFLNKVCLGFVFALPPLLFLILSFFSITTFCFVKYIKANQFDKLNFWLKIPFYKKILVKYYTLKFCLYFKEMVFLKYDFSTIMTTLSTKIDDSFLKMMTYEINEEITKGYALDDIIDHQEYLDEYFKTVMHLCLYHSNPYQLLEQYFQVSVNEIDFKTKKYTNLMVYTIYGIVGLYIVGIYLGLVLPMTNMLNQL